MGKIEGTIYTKTKNHVEAFKTRLEAAKTLRNPRLLFLALAAIALVFVQFLFFLLQTVPSSALEKAVISELRTEKNSKNLSAFLLRLEDAGTIHCTRFAVDRESKLQPHPQASCSSHFFNLSGARSEIRFISETEQTIDIEFLSTNDATFAFCLWLARAFSIATALLLTRRARHLQVESENEKLKSEISIQGLKNQIEKLSLELQSAVRVIEVAAKVAHDIKSPLNAFSLTSQKITEVAPKEAAILTQASRMIQTNADRLMMTAKEASRSPLRKARLAMPFSKDTPAILFDDFKNSIENVIKLKKAEHPQARLNLYWVVNEKNYLVAGCSEELCDIISNVVNNAVEVISLDGFITVTVDKDEVSTMIEIRDSGPGFPDHVLRKIGEFGNTTKPNGNGIALANAKRTIESWGGNLEIHSKADFGSAIYIRLPSGTLILSKEGEVLNTLTH